jgi:hypothetical protein
VTRRRILWLAILLAIATTVAYVRFVRPEAPAGQPPLTTIDAAALQTLRTEFNEAADKVRIIVLLSPT